MEKGSSGSALANATLAAGRGAPPAGPDPRPSWPPPVPVTRASIAKSDFLAELAEEDAAREEHERLCAAFAERLRTERPSAG